jgi:hypothetical protein
MKKLLLTIFLFILFLPIFTTGTQASVTTTFTQLYAVSTSWTNRSMALDRYGRVYILSTYNNLNGYIRVHDNLTGNYLFQFSRGGTADGQIATARGLALDPWGYVFVSDSGNNRIQKFSADGVYLSKFGSAGAGSGQFSNPGGIAIDPSGNIYVVDTGNNRVQVFNNSGVFQFAFGSAGAGNGQFNAPEGIGLDIAGNIYIADKSNNRIQVFNSAGVYQSQFGTAGTGNGQFASPMAVSVASSGDIYVADTNNHRVQIFTSAGVYVSQFGSLGTGDYQFNLPILTVDSSNNIYVGNTALNQGRIKKYSFGGTAYQVSNLGTGLDLVDVYRGLNIESGGAHGVYGAAAHVRLTNTNGNYISDLNVNFTADRDWSSVTADLDLTTGKSVVASLIGAPGAGSSHILWVPIIPGWNSSQVRICPDATNLSGVSDTCTNGVEHVAGTFTDPFGTITVSKVYNVENSHAYWRIVGMPNGGAMATGYATFSGSGDGSSGNPFQITNCTQLQEMSNFLASEFILMNDIDCSATPTWNGGAGFLPVGDEVSPLIGGLEVLPFTGKLDGQGFSISDLFIRKIYNYLGLFGYGVGAEVFDLNLVNIDYEISESSPYYPAEIVGGLFGYISDGTITNVTSSGTIEEVGTGWVDNVGGLIGESRGATTITFSSSSVDITLNLTDGDGGEGIGGFIGWADDDTLIEDSYATGSISMDSDSYQVGGFVGWMHKNTVINRSYATGTIHVSIGATIGWGDNYDIGGFVGGTGGAPVYSAIVGNMQINDSYFNGVVIADGEDNYDIGGFAGTIYDGTVVSNCYAKGTVVGATANNAVAGFVGLMRQRYIGGPPTVHNSYADVNVYADYDTYELGGFVGEHRSGLIDYSYALGDVYGGSEGNEYEYIGTIGGFAGSSTATIRGSFSMGNVYTMGEAWDVGGFLGWGNTNSLIENSASLGSHVDGFGDVGGFVGGYRSSSGTSTIRNSYSITNVVGRYADFEDATGYGAAIGGFVGWLGAGGILENAYSTGTISSFTNPISGISTALTSDITWDQTVITVDDASGITPGSYLIMDEDTAILASTTLTVAVPVGAASITVADATLIPQYSYVTIEPGVAGKEEQFYVYSKAGNVLNTYPSSYYYTDYAHDPGASVVLYDAVNTEVVLVRNVNGNDLTVTREMAYSYNEDHTAGTIVESFNYPSIADGSGGFLGDVLAGTMSGSYWDTETSGYATSFGSATGYTTAQMKSSANFSGWDFVNIWGINSAINSGYPILYFDDATLSDLTFSETGLTPSFSRFTYAYSATLDGSVTEVTFTPTTFQTLFQRLTVDGVEIDSGDPIQVALDPGDNTILVQVLSYSNRLLTYTFDIYRDAPPVTPTVTPSPTEEPTTPTPTAEVTPTVAPTTTTVQPTATTIPQYVTPTPECIFMLNGVCISEVEIKNVTTVTNGNSVQICWETNIPTTGKLNYGIGVLDTISEPINNDLLFCKSLDDLEYDSDYIFEIVAEFDEDHIATYEGEFSTGIPATVPTYSCSINSTPTMSKIDGEEIVHTFITDNAESCTVVYGETQNSMTNYASVSSSLGSRTAYFSIKNISTPYVFYKITCESEYNQCSESDRIAIPNRLDPGNNLKFSGINFELSPSEFLALTGLVLTFLPLSISYPQFWLYGIAWVFPRKKYRPWGIIFDNVSKSPIPFAVVRLYGVDGHLVKQSVTDLQGKYSFIIDPGTYQMSVEHQDYARALKQISILREDSKIAENLGLMPLTSDKPLSTRLKSSIGKIFLKAYWIIGFIGMGFSFLAMVINFIPINIAIFVLYIVQLALMIMLRPKRDFGFVYSMGTGERIKGAFIQVQDVAQGRQVDVQMSDERGRFGFNLDKGEYLLIVKVGDQSPKSSDLQSVQLPDGSVGYKYDPSVKGFSFGFE